MRKAVLEKDVPVVEKELFLTNTQQACHQRIQSLRRDWIITASNVSLIFRVKQHNKCSIFQNLAERKPNTNMKIPEYQSIEQDLKKIITKECFFLELRSNVVWYSISTKFFRQGTLTSFFTA